MPYNGLRTKNANVGNFRGFGMWFKTTPRQGITMHSGESTARWSFSCVIYACRKAWIMSIGANRIIQDVARNNIVSTAERKGVGSLTWPRMGNMSPRIQSLALAFVGPFHLTDNVDFTTTRCLYGS